MKFKVETFRWRYNSGEIVSINMKRVCGFAVFHISYALLLRTYMQPIRLLLPTE